MDLYNKTGREDTSRAGCIPWILSRNVFLTVKIMIHVVTEHTVGAPVKCSKMIGT